jgi:hypothetical protein
VFKKLMHMTILQISKAPKPIISIVGHCVVPARHAARPCRAGTTLGRVASRRADRAVPDRAMGQAFGP